jgi:hypothetical protein
MVGGHTCHERIGKDACVLTGASEPTQRDLLGHKHGCIIINWCMLPSSVPWQLQQDSMHD